MDISIPLQSKVDQFHADWLTLDSRHNTAVVRCGESRVETLIYVVFGSDFIAGLRTDRRTWVLIPARAIASVSFEQFPGLRIPEVRQTSVSGREYLQGLGALHLRVWPIGQWEPLPAGFASVQGGWLVLSRSNEADAAGERAVPFDSIALIEVADMTAAFKDITN
jgi:hypothetical protein